MAGRLFLWLVTAFFITMNVLLWRSEFSGRGELGVPVPIETLWHRILRAPDMSSLDILHRGVKIGSCRWMPSVGEVPVETGDDREVPEGMVQATLGYNLDFNGTVALDETTRLRFNFDLKLGTNHQWQEMIVRLQVRPNQWEVHALAPQRTLKWSTYDGQTRLERDFAFDELRQPDKLLRQLGGPLLPPLLAAMGFPLEQRLDAAPLGLKPDWEARHDWLKLGHARIRVYRLRVRALDRYEAVAFVSPAGEILRVELPDDLILVNDALTSL